MTINPSTPLSLVAHTKQRLEEARHILKKRRMSGVLRLLGAMQLRALARDAALQDIASVEARITCIISLLDGYGQKFAQKKAPVFPKRLTPKTTAFLITESAVRVRVHRKVLATKNRLRSLGERGARFADHVIGKLHFPMLVRAALRGDLVAVEALIHNIIWVLTPGFEDRVKTSEQIWPPKHLVVVAKKAEVIVQSAPPTPTPSPRAAAQQSPAAKAYRERVTKQTHNQRMMRKTRAKTPQNNVCDANAKMNKRPPLPAMREPVLAPLDGDEPYELLIAIAGSLSCSQRLDAWFGLLFLIAVLKEMRRKYRNETLLPHFLGKLVLGEEVLQVKDFTQFVFHWNNHPGRWCAVTDKEGNVYLKLSRSQTALYQHLLRKHDLDPGRIEAMARKVAAGVPATENDRAISPVPGGFYRSDALIFNAAAR